jgi:PAS domain S-box-containing protein
MVGRNDTEVQLIRELAEARQRISELESAAVLYKQTDEELQKSHKQLQAVLDASLDAITLTNEQGLFLACNKALLERWEKSRDQLLGHSAGEVLPPAILQNSMDRVRRVLKTGESDHFINERDGLWFENTIAPIIETDGSIKIVALFSRDITERKNSEKALLESESKYRELVENSNSIILHWNRQGEITFMNESGQKFFGYSEAEILGRNVVGTICHLLWKKSAGILSSSSETSMKICEAMGSVFGSIGPTRWF